jgi:hypothetical protein
MDDNRLSSGWVPAERSIPPPDDSIYKDTGTGNLFTPTIFPESARIGQPPASSPSAWSLTPPGSPAPADPLSSTGPSIAPQPSNAHAARPSNPPRPSARARPSITPRPSFSARRLAPPRPRASGGTPTGRLGLRRLHTLLLFARPSTWHAPARLGSGPVRTARLLLARRRRPLTVGLVLIGLWITIRSAVPTPPATVPVLLAARDLPAGQALTSDDLRRGNWPADQAPSGRLNEAAGRTLASPIRIGELLTDARVIGPGLLEGQPPGTVAMPVRLGDPAAGTLVRAGDRVDVLVASSSWSTSAWSEPDLADGTAPRAADPSAAADPPTAADPPAVDSPGPGGSLQSSGTGTGTGTGNPSSGDGQVAQRVATGALVLAAPAASGTESSWSGSTGTGLSGLTGGLPGASSGDGSGAGLLVLAVSAGEARRLAAVQSGHYLGIAVLPPR